MSEILKCPSCGGTNQLPEGKSSMFCAFCGNAIEKKESEDKTSLNFPKIISGELQIIPLKESFWYEQKISEQKARIKVAQMSNNKQYKVLKDFTHAKASDGWNVTITYIVKRRNDFLEEEFKESEFVPFEYDKSHFESKLDLNNHNIKSILELRHHYELQDLKLITHLNLSNNSIRNWEGMEIFENLQWLDISNNQISTFPSTWPQKKEWMGIIIKI